MKKRFLSLLLSFCFLFSFAACNSSSASFDEEKLKEKSIAFATQMTQGDFDTVTNSFSSATKQKLNAKQLKDGWDQTAGTVGKYKQVHSSETNVTPTSAQVKVILEFEDNGIVITFTYNKSEEIDGIWINFSALTNDLVQNEYFEESAITVPAENIDLKGVLTLPKADSFSTVALLVQGSGSSDYNESVNQNKPFRDIAHALGQKNIATLRYNKRYYQNPGLASANYTIEDEVLNDVNKAIALIRSDTRLTGKKLVIIGHSLGGMLAPKIASDNKDVAAIVSLAGSPRKLEDISYDQNKQAIAQLKDKTDKEKETLLKNVKTEIDKIKALKGDETTGTILQVPVSYWNSLNKIDTPKIAKELDIPILIMQGSADFQITNTDYKAWKTALKDKKNATYKWYNDLNHLFMKTNGKTDVSEYEKKSTVDTNVTKDLSEWINKLP